MSATTPCSLSPQSAHLASVSQLGLSFSHCLLCQSWPSSLSTDRALLYLRLANFGLGACAVVVVEVEVVVEELVVLVEVVVIVEEVVELELVVLELVVEEGVVLEEEDVVEEEEEEEVVVVGEGGGGG